MEPRQHQLKDSRILLICEAEVEDARAVLEYLQGVCDESEFLIFGPGEFELGELEEEEFLGRCLALDNQLCILGTIDDAIVAALNFSTGRRPRIRHSGEFGISVRK